MLVVAENRSRGINIMVVGANINRQHMRSNIMALGDMVQSIIIGRVVG